jgi:outer membrane protein OmpA-like peptidoglycan-associated protein
METPVGQEVGKRRRAKGVLMKRIAVFLVAAAAVGAALRAEAGVAYHGTRGLVRTLTADNIGKGKLNFQLGGHYFQYPDEKLLAGPYTGATVDYHLMIARATLTYALSEYLEVGANLDVRARLRDPKDKAGYDIESVTRGGLGDTQVSGKLSVPLPTSVVKLGGFGEASFATGDEERGFTSGKTDVLVLGLLTLDFVDLESFVPTRLHFNSGYRFDNNEKEGYGIFDPADPAASGFPPPAYPPVPATESNSFNDLFVFNTAVEFPAPQMTFFVEFDWQRLLVDADSVPTGTTRDTYTLTPGFAYNISKSVELKLAGDININSGSTPSLANPPDWALWLMLAGTWELVPQDRDRDGVPDNKDGCPDQPEDVDGFQDDDGCPDADNDGDGRADKDDTCPDLAEDADGFQDDDGCPDLDNDQDGIPDKEDRCPNEAEDFDGDADTDGCPDLVKDSDKDGVSDDVDRCPLQAEDVDGFQDEDGCPDLDNDLDGIPDASDKCPNAPEAFNGIDDEDGCPDDKPIERQSILKGVNFESGSAVLTPDSHRILDEAVRSLLAYPDVKVEILGYTDSVGQASANLALSQRRAESVKQYLVNAGIDPARLTARGLGEEDPVASNATPEGRAQNRRIEYRRLN